MGAGKFLGGTAFFWLLRRARVLFIGGMYGTGKSLLSMAIASELWRNGWVEHIHSNLVLRGDWDEPLPYQIRNAAVVFDEAWQDLDARNFSAKSSQRWMAYLRKRNNILLLPSIHNIDVRLRTLVIYRMGMLGENGLWIYRWKLQDAFKPVGGSLLLYRPLTWGAMYDHIEEPDWDRGTALGDALARAVPVPPGSGRELVQDVPGDILWEPSKKK